MRKSLLPILLVVFTACQKEVSQPLEASKPQKQYLTATINGEPFVATDISVAARYGINHKALAVSGFVTAANGDPISIALIMEGFYVDNTTVFPLFQTLNTGYYYLNGLHYALNGQAQITTFGNNRTAKGKLVSGTFAFDAEHGYSITNGKFAVLLP